MKQGPIINCQEVNPYALLRSYEDTTTMFVQGTDNNSDAPLQLEDDSNSYYAPLQLEDDSNNSVVSLQLEDNETESDASYTSASSSPTSNVIQSPILSEVIDDAAAAASRQAPSKEIVGSIDPQNIIEGRRRRVMFAVEKRGKKRKRILKATIQELDVNEICDPNNYKDAIIHPKVKEWKKAMDSELDSISSKSVYRLVPLPAGKKAIPTRWVYTKKYDEHGNVIKYKARAVIRGFYQDEAEIGETFAPVTKSAPWKTILALATENNWEIHQQDVTTAFLNAPMEGEVYVQPPEGSNSPPGMVWKLDKALYGLAASPRLWYNCIAKVFKTNDFKISAADPCIFYKKTNKGCCFISLYVDDLVITGGDNGQIREIKNALSLEFEMKDLGPISTCLGMEITRDQVKGTTQLTQKTYTKKILLQFGMQNSIPCDTPMITGFKLTKEMSPITPQQKLEMSSIPYRCAVGSLLYLSLHTRPDIASAVSIVAKYAENPGLPHWQAVKRIFRYLNGTRATGLLYKRGGGDILSAYSDADWAGDRDDRKSRSGCAIFLGQNLVSWKSKRQKCTAQSTSESEYIALSEAGKEIVWLRSLLQELGLEQKEPTVIWEDNTICIHTATNPVTTDRQKHIDIRYHWIREAIEMRRIEVKYCSTNKMTADIFTKALNGPKFSILCKNLGMIHCS